MQKLRKLLRPDWWKFILFAIFVAIAIGGKIQAWAFSDMPPKPLLYDLLRPFPILLSPLALFTGPLTFLGLDIMGGPSWLFWTANVIYFYLLSCLTVAGARWIKTRWKSQIKMEN